MMKYALLLTSCFLSAISYGQSSKFAFKLGTAYELPRRTEDLSFFGNQKDGIVNLSLKKEELIILRFDPASLRQTMERKIDLDATRNFNSEMVAEFRNNNYYWIHSDWDKSAEKEFLYYDKIDVSSGKIVETNKKMIETTKMGGDAKAIGWYRYKKTDKYQYNFDAEKKHLLVTYRLSPEERNDKKNYDKLGFHVFNEQMEKVWGTEFKMPYTEAVMDNSDFTVDSDGNAYLLAKVYDNDSRKEIDKATGNPAYRYEILKFTKDSKKPTIVPIKIEGHFIKQTTLVENSNHDLIVACTYSKKAKGSFTDGVFLATVGQDGKLVRYKNGFFEFPLEELQKFEKSRNRRKMEKKDDYEAANLQVRDVIVESDGGLLITCEEYHWKETYSTSGSYTRVRITHYYDDILACKIDATGKFKWVKKIPKRQMGDTRVRGTMSFKLINDETGYYFLYLDNLKNLNLGEDQEPRVHIDGAGGQVMVTKVTREGAVTKELLFDTREQDVMIFPAEFERLDGNKFIGRAQLKRNLFQPLLITSK